MNKKVQKILLKVAISFCVVIYTLDLYLIFTSPNAIRLKQNIEKIFARPIYITKTVTSILMDRQQPLASKSAYTITLVGDSMTDFLKQGQDNFRDSLKVLYPGRDFVIYNYGFGSTNILSVGERINHNVNYQGQDYPAIIGQQFDLILLESFGNNPLSQFPVAEGLKKQTEELDKIMTLLRNKRPRSFVVFVATISPNRFSYGEGSVKLDQTQKDQWVEERESYMKNHLAYAKSHNIPFIDVYSASKGEDGTGKKEYLNPNDNIHPSPAGVKFIFEKIAKEIYDQRIIPL